jgi:ABC-type branched-subunit amino acid transport system ATPase component
VSEPAGAAGTGDRAAAPGAGPAAVGAPAPLLRVDRLSKAFGGVRAVRDVGFELHAGELLALIGPNGAGKTTCFNMVNGQLRPDAGSVTLAGRQLVGLRPEQIWREGVGRTFQIAETFASLTVIENVQVALLSAPGTCCGSGSRHGLSSATRRSPRSSASAWRRRRNGR